jgi:hypothetical protein
MRHEGRKPRQIAAIDLGIELERALSGEAPQLAVDAAVQLFAP